VRSLVLLWASPPKFNSYGRDSWSNVSEFYASRSCFKKKLQEKWQNNNSKTSFSNEEHAYSMNSDAEKHSMALYLLPTYQQNDQSSDAPPPAHVQVQV